MFPRPAACLTTLLLLVSLALPPSAAAMSADEAFAEGNRLFRDDLYWAALLRYRQARDAGMNTATLAYNTGVAHYRAGQHRRAREALLEAVDDPGFRVAAQYNLGLNANALGDTDEALRWFLLARDQQAQPVLSEYAAVAIARIREARVDEQEAIVERAATVEKTRKFANLLVSAQIGFGTDDNPFRTPNQAYVDLADPDQPLVTPEVRSGAFMPVSLNAKYLINALEHEGFFLAYRLAGRVYQDQELENANEFVHEGSFGSEFRRTTERHTREIYSAFRFAQNDRTYFDPDDGLEREVEDDNELVAVGDRLNYTRYGPELTLRQTGRRFTLALEIKGQLWDYEDVEAVPSYDHEFFLGRASVQYRFTRTSMIMLQAARYNRRFTNRPSFDLDGNQFITNAELRYEYLDLGVTARQRVTNSLWFGLSYTRTDRDDRFEGYNDYLLDAFGAEIQFTPGSRFRFEAKGVYRLFDYPNAFAFHDPTANPKTQEDVVASLKLSYRVTPSLSLVAEGQYRETASNDIRIQYERTLYTLGVRWQR